MLNRIMCAALLLVLAGCTATTDETPVSAPAAADTLMTDTGASEDEAAPALEGEPCPEPRPVICTLQYAPVCGLGEDGFRGDYGNFCGACGDPRVLTVIEGECPAVAE